MVLSQGPAGADQRGIQRDARGSAEAEGASMPVLAAYATLQRFALHQPGEGLGGTGSAVLSPDAWAARLPAFRHGDAIEQQDTVAQSQGVAVHHADFGGTGGPDPLERGRAK